MANRLLIDTDVLIDYSRRHPEAVSFMRQLGARPALSAVTVSELYAGVREGKERTELDAFVQRSIIIDLDAQIAARAGLLLRQYRPSHGVGLADAIIAATAEIENATLVTLNLKHYPMFPDAFAPYKKS